jgi:hypothetical protein
MTTTTRIVFEALAPAGLDAANLDEVFAKDGTLRRKCRARRTSPSFAVWSLLVSDAAPMRPFDDIMGVAMMGDPDARKIANLLLDWADTERASCWRAFVAFTEPCGKWRCPSSRELAAWPSPERLSEVFAATMAKLDGAEQ